MNTRTCKKCSVSKPANIDNFRATHSKDKSKTYLRNTCRDCEVSHAEEYRAERRDLLAQKAKDYRQADISKAKEISNRYNGKNKEKRSQWFAAWSLENPDKIQQYRQEAKARYNQSPPVKTEEQLAERRDYLKKWRLVNRTKDREYTAMRRARRLGAVTEPISRSVIIERDARTCYLCGKNDLEDANIAIDHVVPLARGGSHTYENQRVTCRSCNSHKSDRLLSELTFGWLNL